MKFKVFSKIRFFFLIYSVMIFSACHDSDKIEPEYGERTVLIYMAADNNLNKDGETNIKSILKGMEQTAGRLVITIDPRYDVPRLLTVKGGKDAVWIPWRLIQRKIRLHPKCWQGW